MRKLGINQLQVIMGSRGKEGEEELPKLTPARPRGSRCKRRSAGGVRGGLQERREGTGQVGTACPYADLGCGSY